MADYISGIDTSHWEDDTNPNNAINWQTAKNNGIKFVILKATEGLIIKDQVYTQGKNNLSGILPRGSYHFYRTAGNPVDQAKYYYDYAGTTELPPMLDLEDYYKELPTGNALVNVVVQMLKAIDDKFGKETILYTSPNIIKNYFGSAINSDITGRKLWIAHYGVPSPQIAPFSNWIFWQYSESGPAAQYGITKSNTVDMNYYNGVDSDFYAKFNIDPAQFGGQPAPSITSSLFQALNSHDPAQVTALYKTDGVHVLSGQTIQGSAAISSWYTTFFNSTLPNATFTLVSANNTPGSLQITWQAVSPSGNVKNGSDTLSIMDGQIAFHYSSYTITPP